MSDGRKCDMGRDPEPLLLQTGLRILPGCEAYTARESGVVHLGLGQSKFGLPFSLPS